MSLDTHMHASGNNVDETFDTSIRSNHIAQLQRIFEENIVQWNEEQLIESVSK